jgi:hypothetical protein
MIVAWIFMAMGLTLANLDPLVDNSCFLGARACVGWPFIYVSGFSTFAYSLSSGYFGAASLLANVAFAATFMIISAAVLRACTWQRGSAMQFRLSDLFLGVTAAGILVFLVQWDRNLASLDFGLHFPGIGVYCPLARLPLHVQVSIWLAVYCVVVASIRTPFRLLRLVAKRRHSPPTSSCL